MGEVDKRSAKPWQYEVIKKYGLIVREDLWIWIASKLIADLESGKDPEDAARQLSITDWELVPPTEGQVWRLQKEGLPQAKTKRLAALYLNAKLDPVKVYKEFIKKIDNCLDHAQLDVVGKEMSLVKNILRSDCWDGLAEAGKNKREGMGPRG